MDYHTWDKIEKSLQKTNRAVISLGCSFVEGQGAYDQEVLEGLEWIWEGIGIPMEPKLNDKIIRKLLHRYPELELLDDGKIDFKQMFYKNSFVNVLCEKYLESTYTGVNFGLSGKGNRASIKNLQIWPYDWKKLDDIIVIYCPSGMERFDMVNDDWKGSSTFTTIWPHPQKGKTPKANMWNGFGEGVYSEKSAVIEQILHFIELKQWCQLHNAKLIITPAFDKTYNKSYFEKTLYTKKTRNMEYQLINEELETRPTVKEHLNYLIDQWSWDNMFYPNSCSTFIDLCIKQEDVDPNKVNGYWEYQGTGSPKKWITHCCHPSAKAHDLFANLLHRKIKDINNGSA